MSQRLGRDAKSKSQGWVAVASRKRGRKRKSQGAVAAQSQMSQETQVDTGADANQTLTLRGDECLRLGEVQNGLYTEL